MFASPPPPGLNSKNQNNNVLPRVVVGSDEDGTSGDEEEEKEEEYSDQQEGDGVDTGADTGEHNAEVGTDEEDHAETDKSDESDELDGEDTSDTDGEDAEKETTPDGPVKKAAAETDILDGERSSGSGLNPTVVNKKGTGPTKVGYVKDFLQERRENPGYHTGNTLKVQSAADRGTPDSSSSLVAWLVHETSVRLCTGTDPRCLDPNTPLIAYNPERFPRTWCRQEIKPQSAVTMKEHCTNPIVHLFPTEVPPVSGEHMPPIIFKSSLDAWALVPEDGTLETVECNIPCRQQKGMEGVERYIEGETWRVTQTMADGAFQNEAMIERRDFMKDHFY
jgi:hypothetical protein